MGALFLVTVKLPRNPDHNPRAKVTAPCQLGSGLECTDVTGEHHTYLVEATSRNTAQQHAEQHHGHVTRIEETRHVGSAAAVARAWVALPPDDRAAVERFAPELVEALLWLRRTAGL